MNTDNSKVNTNLLKENEALKERITLLEDYLNELFGSIEFGSKENIIETKESIENALNPKTEK